MHPLEDCYDRAVGQTVHLHTCSLIRALDNSSAIHVTHSEDHGLTVLEA